MVTDAAPSAATEPAPDTAGPPRAPSIGAKLRQFIQTRRLTPVTLAIGLTGFAMLFGLGTWQMMRLHQKNTVITTMTSLLRQNERDLRLRPPANDAAWRDLDYRRVVLQGDWLTLHPLKVLPRTYEGANGYHLFMPLILFNGQVVLVNRGWVPDKTELGPTSSNTGSVIVAGIVRLAPAEKPFGMLDNSPAKNQWAWPDLAAMARDVGVGQLAPVIVYAERAGAIASDDNQTSPDHQAAETDSYPIGGQAQLMIRNEHKSYALTWYSLAFAFLVIWLLASRQKAPPPVVVAQDE